MATKWPEPVQNSEKLLIWASASATAGWSVALERAVKEFNRATHTRKLALRFELTTRESDAQVKFGIGKPEDFRLSTHGTTSLSSIEQSGEILKTDILVHPKPQVWAPRKKQGSKEYEQVQRDAGDGVRLVIIAHEFVHACGLEKHSNNESQDVFYSPLEPNGGDKPQDDYMKVPIKGAFDCHRSCFRLRPLAGCATSGNRRLPFRSVALGRRNRIHIESKEARPRVAGIILVVATCRRLKISIGDYLGSVRAVINSPLESRHTCHSHRSSTRRTTEERKAKDEHTNSEIGHENTESGVTAGVGGCATRAPREGEGVNSRP